MDSLQVLEEQAKAAQGAQRGVALLVLARGLFDINPRRALSVAVEAAQDAIQWGDEETALLSRSAQAWCYMLLGHNQEGLTLGHQTLEEAKQAGLLEAQGLAHKTLAHLFYNLGNLDQAIEHWLDNLHIQERRGTDGNIGLALTPIAIVYSALGRYEQSQHTFERAIALARAQQDHVTEARALLALIHHVPASRADLPQAIVQCQEALHILETAGHRQGEATALYLLGELYRDLGDRVHAHDAFEQALSRWRIMEDAHDQLIAQVTLGTFHLSTDPVRARGYLRDALALAEAIGARTEQSQVHEALATLDEQQGDLAAALAHHKKFHELFRDLFNEEADNKLKKLQVLHEVEQIRQEADLYRLRQQLTQEVLNVYVTPQVAEHALTHGTALGAQVTEATVLFADLRGFTNLTEQMEPHSLVALLNAYFDVMAEIIHRHHGLIHEIAGDELYASFGSPLYPSPTHAADAVRAARAMCAALETFNRTPHAPDWSPLRVGIGIATGAVLAGHVGSSTRRTYTLMGDTVNLAARLQEMNKHLGTTVLLSPHTAQAVGEAGLVAHGPTPIRGKQHPVDLFSLPPEKGSATN